MLQQANFADFEPAVRAHLANFTSPTDSWYEDHVLESNHCRIMSGNSVAGFASIHERMLITQFSLDPAWRHLGQLAFYHLRPNESARSALVGTSAEFFLAHALDDYRSNARQAYFFALAHDRVPPVPAGFRLQAATPEDTATIREHTGDFFEPVDASIADGKVFLAFREEKLVGFGIMEISTLREATASIGMYTITSSRGQGGGHGHDCAHDRRLPAARTPAGRRILVLQPSLEAHAGAMRDVYRNPVTAVRVLGHGHARNVTIPRLRGGGRSARRVRAGARIRCLRDRVW